jgi:uncharacterized membrane protein
MNPNKKTTKDWRDNDPDKETSDRWKNNPNNWKFGGFIYFNKEDKRLFVTKKVEWMGTTLNFANPKWILFMIGFILFFVFVNFMILRSR